MNPGVGSDVADDADPFALRAPRIAAAYDRLDDHSGERRQTPCECPTQLFGGKHRPGCPLRVEELPFGTLHLYRLPIEGESA